MTDPTNPRRGRPPGSPSLSWRALFQQSDTPVFVLGRGRRLRYANPAWERLAGAALADALGMVCSARRHATALAAALAPTPDALAGRPDAARRPAPTGRGGPPWWDVTFVPLAAPDGPAAVVGFVRVVGDADAPAARKLSPAAVAVRERHAAAFTLDLLAGVTQPAERLVAQVRHAANSPAPLWLVGEPGSGKETVARVAHHAGANRERTFLSLDCGGLQPYLIDSLLFGHGGLAASGRVGTVYLKDPAALPRDVQQRFVELFADPASTAPRLVCGSERPALDAVRTGRLLPDFHTALSVLEVAVPPLRDRLDDLPRFVARLLERESPTPALDPAAVDVLRAQPWPGNLRELAGVLADAAAAAGAGPVTRDHLPHAMRVRAGLEPPAKPAPFPTLDAALEDAERQLIRRALEKCRGNASKAAGLLAVPRGRLLRRMAALGLGEEEWPQKGAEGTK